MISKIVDRKLKRKKKNCDVLLSLSFLCYNAMLVGNKLIHAAAL